MIVRQSASLPWRFEDARYSLKTTWRFVYECCVHAAYSFSRLGINCFRLLLYLLYTPDQRTNCGRSEVQSYLNTARKCESGHPKEGHFLHLQFTHGFWSGYAPTIGFATFSLKTSKLHAQNSSLQETSVVYRICYRTHMCRSFVQRAETASASKS